MRFLGIDYGSKRVGVALSDLSGQFALPHLVLQNDKKLLPNIKKICEENFVEEIVLGESRDFKGQENPIMKKINLFKDQLEKEISKPVHFELEFLTSAEASRTNPRRDMRPSRKTKENVILDASAAALILKSYLEKMRN